MGSLGGSEDGGLTISMMFYFLSGMVVLRYLVFIFVDLK
jgi:hypothetical protein